MPGNEGYTTRDVPGDDAPDEDIPDMTTPYWQEKFAEARARRGRPPSEAPKVSTTIRLDPDVIAAFKADGPGWQSRINAALRRAAGLDT